VGYFITAPCPCHSESEPRFAAIFPGPGVIHEMAGAHLKILEGTDPLKAEFRTCPGDNEMSDPNER
jgi:hypothetical protein